jgi:hypothetical protein
MEQEQMIHLLVAKVGYDGKTGKVTINFRSAGAKERPLSRSRARVRLSKSK